MPLSLEGSSMIPYSKFRPTTFDPSGLGLGDKQAWLVLPVSQTRDSGPLEESNFEAVQAALKEADPSGESWEVHRFGHWGPGWFEIVIIDPAAPATLEVALELEAALASYPVLDEQDFSQRENDIAAEAWESLSLRERIRLCAKHKVSIFRARCSSAWKADPLIYDDLKSQS